MATTVTVKASGGSPQIVDNVTTVGDVKKKLNLEKYVATRNGQPVDDADELEEGNFITLSAPVKGA